MVAAAPVLESAFMRAAPYIGRAALALGVALAVDKASSYAWEVKSAQYRASPMPSALYSEGTKDEVPGSVGDSPTEGDESLPTDPDELLERGYKETSHPEAAEAGHRTFENPASGDKVRFDKGKPGRPGHEGKDHYHRPNPKATGKQDEYLDAGGKPVRRGHEDSHLYPRK